MNRDRIWQASANAYAQAFIVATSHRFREEHDLLQMPTAQRRGSSHDVSGPSTVTEPLEIDP